MIRKKISLAPDASLLASITSPGVMAIVNPGRKGLENVKQLLDIYMPDGFVSDMTFDGRSQHLYAGGSAGRLYRWKTDNWKKGSTENHLEPIGEKHEDTITAIRPGNTNVVATGDKAGNIRVISLDTGVTLHHFKTEGQVTSLVLSPNDKTLVSGTFEHLGKVNVEMWDLESNKRQDSMLNVSEKALCLRISPNGRQFAVGQMAGLQIFDLIDQDVTYEAKGGTISSITYSPCGRVFTLIESGEGLMSLWDSKKISCITVLQEQEPTMQEVGIAYLRPMVALALEGSDLKFFELDLNQFRREQ